MKSGDIVRVDLKEGGQMLGWFQEDINHNGIEYSLVSPFKDVIFNPPRCPNWVEKTEDSITVIKETL